MSKQSHNSMDGNSDRPPLEGRAPSVVCHDARDRPWGSEGISRGTAAAGFRLRLKPHKVQ